MGRTGGELKNQLIELKEEEEQKRGSLCSPVDIFYRLEKKEMASPKGGDSYMKKTTTDNQIPSMPSSASTQPNADCRLNDLADPTLISIPVRPRLGLKP